MNALLSKAMGFFQHNGWLPILAESFLLIFLTFVFSFICKISLIKLKQFFERNNFFWYLEITNALEKSLYKSLWIVSITLIIELLSTHLKLSFTSFIPIIRNIAVIWIIANAIWQAIDKFEVNLLSKTRKNQYKIDKTTVDILSKLFKAIIFIIAGLSAMQALGMNISGILALGGISGLAVGFASKDLLSNFFGTIMIYLDKPFTIGELIKIDGKSGAGTVEKIDWRMTTIRTDEKKQLFVPNSIFLSATIENSSRISHKAFAENLKIMCSDYNQIAPLLANLKDYLKSNKNIDTQQEIDAELTEITQNIIKIKIKGFSKHKSSAEFSDFKNNLLIEIADIVKKHKLELAPLYKDELE